MTKNLLSKNQKDRLFFNFVRIREKAEISKLIASSIVIGNAIIKIKYSNK